jgi:hypothetical protein
VVGVVGGKTTLPDLTPNPALERTAHSAGFVAVHGVSGCGPQLTASVDMICSATDCAPSTSLTTFRQLLAPSLSQSSDVMLCVPYANQRV